MYQFLGLSFFSGSIGEVVNRVAGWIDRNRHTYICITGAHGVIESGHSKQVLQAHQAAGLVVPDGMPLVWIGRLLGKNMTERIYGPDLFLALCKMAEQNKWKIFFYGTTGETLTRLQKQIAAKYPAISIVGSLAPPFRPLHTSEEIKYIKIIDASGAHIVFVGMSTPKQEIWMLRHVKKMQANVLVGVGAAFDFVAGTKRQAPAWMRKTGLEWLFRLLQEPKRLWRRYLIVNTQFIARAFWQLLHPKAN